MVIAIVANPRARGRNHFPRLEERLRRTALAHAVFTPDGIDALRRTFRRWRAGPLPRLVLIAGGDGTLMASLTAMMAELEPARRPPLGVLPCGTVGTVARAWGVAGDPVDWLGRYVERAVRLRPSPCLLVEARSPTAVRHHYGFIFGAGLVAEFFRAYYARGAPGTAGAARMAARIFLESFYGGSVAREILNPVPAELFVGDARQTPSAWSLVCAAVIEDLGLGFRVTYRASEAAAAQALHLVASPLTAESLGPRAPRVWLGRSIGGPGHVDQITSSFTLRFTRGGGHFVLDGDLLAAEEVTVRPGPQFQLALPD
ncbi:MAG: acylglycerol kinase family protein [Myxococcota bacterium]